LVDELIGRTPDSLEKGDVAMNEKERLNALEVAINNEMREREFYLKNAARTTNPLGKAVFEQLAMEELEHADRLKQVRKRWTQLEKWPETVPLKVQNTVIKDILSRVDTRQMSDTDDLGAIRTAIEFEAKGSKLYGEMRDAVADKREKEFFDLLSMIEHEHYLSLVDAEEYLTDPASWYRRTEHHTFDGE
jgi:rubrerythrin